MAVTLLTKKTAFCAQPSPSGDIIVRSNPDAATDGSLDGLNRDLDAAREITKDKSVSMDVYLSPGAIEEIVDIAQKVFGDQKKTVVDLLVDKGLTEEQVKELLQNDNSSVLARLTVEALEKEYGNLENISEEQANETLFKLWVLDPNNPNGKDLLASHFIALLVGADDQPSTYSQYLIIETMKAAGVSAVDTLLLLSDMSAYTFNKASGGLLFPEQALKYEQTCKDTTQLLLSLDYASLPQNIIKHYQEQLAKASALEASGNYAEAAKITGPMVADITLLVASTGGLAVQTAKKFPTYAKILGNTETVGVGAGTAGTVWDSIVATQPYYKGSLIPRSFELGLPNGQKVWLNGNASEHIVEFVNMKATNYTPEAVRLATQQQLSSLQAALNQATAGGITYGQLIKVDNWEFIFAKPRVGKELPAVIHALNKLP